MGRKLTRSAKIKAELLLLAEQCVACNPDPSRPASCVYRTVHTLTILLLEAPPLYSTGRRQTARDTRHHEEPRTTW